MILQNECTHKRSIHQNNGKFSSKAVAMKCGTLNLKKKKLKKLLWLWIRIFWNLIRLASEIFNDMSPHRSCPRPARDLLWPPDPSLHHWRWRAANFDLCSVLMAIEQWGFFSVLHPLFTGHPFKSGPLREPVTFAPIAERLAVELSLPVCVFTT